MGNPERGDLTVIREATSGYFLWRYAQYSGTDHSSSFIDEFRRKASALWVESDGIVEFHMPSSIYVKKHTGRASSLDAAVQASIEEIRHGLAIFESNGFSTNALELKIQELDSDFACIPDNSFCGGGKSKIIALSKDGDKWKLVLRNRYDVELVFDSTFHWVSTRNLSDQVKTKSKMLPVLIAPNSAK